MSLLHIKTELTLARLAVELGAETIGGTLAPDEADLVAAARATEPTDPLIIEEARTLIRSGADPLGDAFCAIRSPLQRRSTGAYYTPTQIVDPMIEWAFRAEPTRFVDPGCGSGRFAAAAVRRDSEIEIIAIDLDPLATLVTRGMLAAIGARRTRVMCGNYLTCAIPSHSGVTAYVGNPPYVRHHDLAAGTKAWANAAAPKVGHHISSLAGLHALFFVATQLHANVGDVGCFVTSAEWLDVGYGAIVRALFTNGLGGRALDLVDPRAVAFKDAMTAALITCFVVGAQPTDVAVRLAATVADLNELEGGRAVASSELAEASRWSYLFRENNGVGHTGRRLGDLAHVHRGFATGDNSFFLMTRDEAHERGLSDWVRPAITSAAEILTAEGVIRDNPSMRVVLDLPATLDRSSHPAVDAYLALGETKGLDRRYLASHRKPWYRIGPVRPAPIVVSYMARQAPRFAANPDGLALLNIGHGVFPTADMTADQSRKLVDTLNSVREQFVGNGRTYYGGLEKFEPREVEALLVPEGLVDPSSSGT